MILVSFAATVCRQVDKRSEKTRPKQRRLPSSASRGNARVIKKSVAQHKAMLTKDALLNLFNYADVLEQNLKGWGRVSRPPPLSPFFLRFSLVSISLNFLSFSFEGENDAVM